MPFLVRVGSGSGAVTFSGLAGFSSTSSVLVIAWAGNDSSRSSGISNMREEEVIDSSQQLRKFLAIYVSLVFLAVFSIRQKYERRFLPVYFIRRKSENPSVVFSPYNLYTKNP